MFYKIFYIIISLSFVSYINSTPTQECPIWISKNGYLNDLGLLSDVVSWNNQDNLVLGVCGNYSKIIDKNGLYDTRMKIYKNLKNNDTIFVFRPTQQTPQGGDIHNERKLSACTFMNDTCFGLVNQRFQQAFLSLIKDLDSNFFSTIKKTNKNVFTIGHSLGGSLQLFMAIYLVNVHNIIPKSAIGLAGPFIGDIVFTNTYQVPLKLIMKDKWWQIETIDKNNPNNYDSTVETYNIPLGGTTNPPALNISITPIGGGSFIPLR